jgi:hypothetical protein
MDWPGWVRLEVDRRASGEPIWVTCLATTADFYGWSSAFPPVTPRIHEGAGGSRFFYPTRQSRNLNGGKSLRISRATSRSGNPAQATNRYRVCRTWGLKHSALLAQATVPDWAWMEAMDGRRRTRDEWLAFPV